VTHEAIQSKSVASEDHAANDIPLPLESIYTMERDRGSQPYLTQPLPDGQVLDWTWQSAMQEVRKVAAWLRDQAWPPGSRVVILAKNSAWWIMADYAVWMAGYVSVPLYPVARDSSLTSLFTHAEPVACFLGTLDQPLSNESEVLKNLAYITLPGAQTDGVPNKAVAWSDLVRDGRAMADSPIRADDALATIIYTSGTTGKPKGVMQSFRSLILMGKSVALANPLRSGETEHMLSYLPLAHVAERAIVEMASLIKPTHIFFSAGLETFQADLRRARVTAFFSIPRLYIRFQQGVFDKLPKKKLNLFLLIPFLGRKVRHQILVGLGLSDARIVSSGGAGAPVEIINWYRKLGVNFVEGYGMTETGITHIPLPGKFRLGYVGTASPYVETRIAENGEVQTRGPMGMLGYYREPELTSATYTQDGFFRTGDRGEIDEQGRLRLVGRLKEEFKTSKGKYVAPSQIENILALSTIFESVAVFGSGMTSPFAIAVLVPNKRKESESPAQRPSITTEVRTAIERTNAQLEHHEHLGFIVLCTQPWTPENGIMTPTLKVRRALIEQRLSQKFAVWENSGRDVIWIDSV
jgi:long-chain acyl-CoA synthetase